MFYKKKLNIETWICLELFGYFLNTLYTFVYVLVYGYMDIHSLYKFINHGENFANCARASQSDITVFFLRAISGP